MRFDLTIDGTDNIQRSFDTLAKSLDALDAKLAKITQGFNLASSGANRLASQASAGGSGGGSQAPNLMNQMGQAANNAAGPLQRLVQAQMRYQQVVASGGNIFDAQYQLAQAQNSFNRAQTMVNGPTGAQRLSRLVSSTRFGAGGAMPLVGQTASALGLGAELVAPLALAAAGLAAFGMALKVSVERVHSWANFFRKSGGDRQGAEQLAGIAAAAGVGMDEAAGAAGELPGGARQLIAKLKAYRSIRDERAARQFAKQNGLEDFSGIRDLSDKSFNSAISGGSNLGYSKKEMRDAQKMMAEWNQTVARVQHDLVRAMMGIVHGFRAFNDFLNSIAKFFHDRLHINLPGYRDSRDKLDRAADKFGEHVDKFGQAVSSAQGAFGGGNRTQSAYPAAYGWYGNQQRLTQDSKYLGAFAG